MLFWLVIFAHVIVQQTLAYPSEELLSQAALKTVQQPIQETAEPLPLTPTLQDSNSQVSSERKARHIIGGAGVGGFVGGIGAVSAPIYSYSTPIVHSVPVVSTVPVYTTVPIVSTISTVQTIPTYGGFGGYGGYGGYGGLIGGVGGFGGVGFGKYRASYHAKGFGLGGFGGGFIG